MLLCLLLPNVLKALGPGQRIPMFTVRQWLKGGPVTPEKIASGQHLMIIFWATWSPICIESIPLLNFFREKYGNKLKMVALTREKPEVVKAFIAKHPEINFPIGLDAGGNISKRYLDVNLVIPQIYLVNDRKILVWRGELIDLERVLAKINSGKFDLKKQQKISAIRKMMQAGIQGNKHDVVIKTSGLILELDPEDPVALRSRLFAHEQRGEYAAALAFLDRLIKRVPDYPQPYFLKLEMLASRPQKSKIFATWGKTIFDRFPNDAEVQNRLALTILDGLPFGSAPLDIALAAAQKSVKLLTAKDLTVRWAAFYTTLSRAYYAIGMLDKAVEVQDKACALLKGMPDEPAANRLAAFYRNILKLRKNTISREGRQDTLK